MTAPERRSSPERPIDTLAQLDAYAQGIKAPTLASGRQEMLENVINEYIR